MGYVERGGLLVDSGLDRFLSEEVFPGVGVEPGRFWPGLRTLMEELVPMNRELLDRRNELQVLVDRWHRENAFDEGRYHAFLKEIGYWEPVGKPFQVGTENVDREITAQAGPQLVVPVNNARYAINAANARWGSLYDAFYGTDVISEEDGGERDGGYNAVRGARVIERGRLFLDETFPLREGSHRDVTRYSVRDGELAAEVNGEWTGLRDASAFVGYTESPLEPASLFLVHHGLHVEMQIDTSHPIGRQDRAGVKDLVLESALTTIMDCEDSVAAVDAEDKTEVYRNWLGLMRGDLRAVFKKGSREMERVLADDKRFTGHDGEQHSLRGRSLLFVRNVGHLMTTSMVRLADGEDVPEGILDTVFTSLIALHDLQRPAHERNSPEGSIYIVKPKMHGSAEVAFARLLFERVEQLLDLKEHTIKMGVMDEERRTSLNLENCIREVKNRIVFINTGFLDRTGDEMHTSMEAGVMERKNEMKSTKWLQAYERSNVATGLRCGLDGRAQIGKGMWAMPDLMKAMLEQKIGHLQAGGNTAWVPSPTAATLHALHYHQLDVREHQSVLKQEAVQAVNDLLTLPIVQKPAWTQREIQEELENNCQSILGYVVRWIDAGIGCSKVPDLQQVGLMEDRATLRISSQHVANWLYHDVCSEEQVRDTFVRMARMVDRQNEQDPDYEPLTESSVAFQAALELVLEGRNQPGGYTEPILHRRRQEKKQQLKISVK